MKIPFTLDGPTRRAGDAGEGTSRLSQKTQPGIGTFQRILETQMAPAGSATGGTNPSEVPDEKSLRKLIEIIRLRMMMDEHMLGSMRDKGSDLSLYQRFARWQMAGPGMPLPSAEQGKAAETVKTAAEKPAQQAAEEIPSVVRVRRASERARQYEPVIQEASKTYGVDPELIRAVIRAESNFKNESTSPKGAMGLMQIMPETAKDLGIRDGYDPRENIMGGTRYLKGLLERYRGDVPTALAAYNWGMGNVERRPDKLPRETRVYINRIQQFMDEQKA
ncbi:MAG TPA: lytic transglycosylase domain-containing protein [Syntrophales bacterium]|nr:lytic transglycosylase domain-containing protein [Syntrophales bacterium]